MCVKFQQKILNSVVVRAHQIFQFFRQITWFLRNKLCLNLGIGSWITRLVLSNYKKESVRKRQF